MCAQSSRLPSSFWDINAYKCSTHPILSLSFSYISFLQCFLPTFLSSFLSKFSLKLNSPKESLINATHLDCSSILSSPLLICVCFCFFFFARHGLFLCRLYNYNDCVIKNKIVRIIWRDPAACWISVPWPGIESPES